MLKTDPTQIHQIIMNLATNAYHAKERAASLGIKGFLLKSIAMKDLSF